MLLNYGFSKYAGKKVVCKDEEIGKVFMGEKTDKYFIAKAKGDLVAILEKGKQGNAEKKIKIDEIKDKYSAGDVVGKCEVYIGEDKVGEVDIYTDRDIKKPNIVEKVKFKVKNILSKEDEESTEK